MFLVYGGAITIVVKQMILVHLTRHEGEKNKVYLIFDPVRAAPAAEHGEITFWCMGLSMYIMYCTCQNQEYKDICWPPATNHILSGWVRRLLLQGFEYIMLLYDRISKIIYHEIAWYTGSKQSNRDSLILDHKPQRVVLACRPTEIRHLSDPPDALESSPRGRFLVTTPPWACQKRPAHQPGSHQQGPLTCETTKVPWKGSSSFPEHGVNPTPGAFFEAIFEKCFPQY